MTIRQDLQKAQQLPILTPGYQPETLEFFDQEGLLLSHTPLGIINCTRPLGHQAQYLAIYVDGEIVFFQENQQILLNRGIEQIKLTEPAIFDDLREELAALNL